MKLRNKQGFTLVELLAVIVVLAIVMGIAAVAITNVLENTRKSAFVSSANQYIVGARNLVNTGEMDKLLGGSSSTYVPTCATTGNTKSIPLSAIKTEKESVDSPYGNKYNTTASYVLVTANIGTAGDTTSCTYSYAIYLTDDVYSIGTASVPVNESALSPSKVLAG